MNSHNTLKRPKMPQPFSPSEKRLKLPFNWPFWLCLGTSFFVGVSLGGVISAHRHKNALEVSRYNAAAQDGRIKLLSSALRNQSDLVASLDKAPQTQIPPSQSSASEPSSGQALKALAAVQVTPVTNQKVALVTTSPPKQANLKPSGIVERQAENPKPVQATDVRNDAAVASTTTSIQSKVLPQAPSTTASSPPAMQPHPDPKSNIQGVTMEKAGITHIWADAVDFKSGTRIRVGEKFPSGEKLLQLDAQLGRIVTDQRQIIIMDAK